MIQLPEESKEIIKCKALRETAIGETKPIELFQMTIILPEKISARIGAHFQQWGSLAQKRFTLSLLALVSTKQTIKGLKFRRRPRN